MANKIMEIMGVLNQAQGIASNKGIPSNKDGVKQAMEMAGMSMKQLKELRKQAEGFINNPIAQSILKSKGINAKEFLSVVDSVIAEENGFTPKGRMGKLDANSIPKKGNSRNDWRKKL